MIMTTLDRKTYLIKLQDRALADKLDRFYLVVGKSTFGVILVDEYQREMESIMGRSVWTHELGLTGLKHLHAELLGQEEFQDPILSLMKIKEEIGDDR